MPYKFPCRLFQNQEQTLNYGQANNSKQGVRQAHCMHATNWHPHGWNKMTDVRNILHKRTPYRKIPDVFYQQHIFAMCCLYQSQNFHIHYTYHLAQMILWLSPNLTYIMATLTSEKT